MPRTHYLPDERVHFTWDVGHEPVLAIDSGDTVVVWTRDVSDNQIGPDSDVSVIAGLDWDRVYPLAGPIVVNGAKPGDTLAVEVLDIHTQGWGWTRDPPRPRPAGRRLPRRLPEDLRHLGRRLRLPRRQRRDPARAVLRHDGRLPGRSERRGRDAARHVRREHGHAAARPRLDAVPARADRRRAVLAAATPTAARATARSASPASRRRCTPRCASRSRRAGRSRAPQYRTPGPAHAARGRRAVLRHDRRRSRPVRRRAGRRARDDRPHRRHLRPRREDAYVLGSLCVDLKISEIVDAGQYIVSALLPEAVFLT